MPARKTLHTRLVKLFYRVVARKHPRGWIEIDWEELPDKRFRLFSEGLERFQLPDLEILDCPPNQHILGYCHGIMCVATGALKASQEEGRLINSNETIDLREHEEEPSATVRMVQSRPGLMRLEDARNKSGDFPTIAVTNYILNAAEGMRSPQSAIQAINLAIELEAGDFTYEEIHSTEDEFDEVLELSNARAYYILSAALEALGNKKEAVEALDKAIARAPFMAESMKDQNTINNEQGFIEDYLSKVDPWEIQARFREQLD